MSATTTYRIDGPDGRLGETTDAAEAEEFSRAGARVTAVTSPCGCPEPNIVELVEEPPASVWNRDPIESKACTNCGERWRV
jgi:hypothetical protein